MKLLFFTGLLFFSMTGSRSFAQEVLTLPQAIDMAIKNNIDVAQRALVADAGAINHKQAKLALLPSVNGDVAHGVNRGRSIDPFTNAFVNQKINYAAYGLGSDVTLFNGFTLRNRIRQNGFAYSAAKLELEQEKDNLTLAVILAYLQVLSNEDQVALANRQVSVTGAQIERLEKLNREGAISPPQLYDLRGQLKEAELNRVTAENAVASSKLALTQLMTVPYDPNIRLEKIAGTELLQQFPSSPAEVYKNAIEKLSLVKAAALRKRSAQEAIKVAKGGLFPTLALGGNLNTNYSSAATQEMFTNITEVPTSNYVLVNGVKQPVVAARENYTSRRINYTNQLSNNVFSNIGLSLRVPIFNSFTVRNRVKLAAIDFKSASLIAENTKVQLRNEIEQAYVNMNNAWERYKILVEQVAAYSESFRAAEVRFNAGVGTTIDYMIAKDNVDRANINLVSAQYDYILRRKILEFYGR